MKAAVLKRNNNQLSIEGIYEPFLETGRAVVRLRACGLVNQSKEKLIVSEILPISRINHAVEKIKYQGVIVRLVMLQI